MATVSSGAFETSVYDAAGAEFPNRIRVEWSSSQSVANNTSTIYWTVKSAGGYGHWFVLAGPITVNIAGITVYSRSDRFEMWVGATLGSGSFTITHNQSGNATLTAWAEAAIYSYAISSTRYGYSVDLPQIPRSSNINVSGQIIGSPITIQISKAVSSFTHTIYWYFGNASGTIASQTSNSSVTWTPPLDLANQIPNSASGVGTLKCITYNNGSSIGETTTSFTLVAPSSMIPSINSFDPSIESTKPSGCGLYVKNNSTVRWTAHVSGVYGSRVVKCTINGSNLNYESNTPSDSYSAVSSTLTTYGKKEYTITITDSRGRTSSRKQWINVEDYNAPLIMSYNSYRSNANGDINNSGEYVTHQITASFYVLNGYNNIKILAYSKESSTNVYGNLVTLKDDSNNTMNYKYTYPTKEFEVDKIYNFKIVISDSVGGYDEKYISVGTKSIPLNIASNNNSVAVGGFAQKSDSNRFDCFWDAHFMSSPIVNSDKNLKCDIKDINIDVIDSLRPVQYKIINEKSDITHYGFIAQDVEQVFIDSGTTNEKIGVVRYEENNETKERSNYAIAYEEIIPLLVKKCQELQQEINELKKK